jgi:hypothetical protein
VDACIISTAQQASPKVIGHTDPCRAQFTTCFISLDFGEIKYRIRRCQHIIHDAFLWLLSLKGRRLSGTCHCRYRGIRSLNNGEACSRKLLWHCIEALASCFCNNGFLTFCQGHGDSTCPEGHGQRRQGGDPGSLRSWSSLKNRFQPGPRLRFVPPPTRPTPTALPSSPPASTRPPLAISTVPSTLRV